MKQIRFYKNTNNLWFADLPSYIEAGGSQSDLQMVLGADVWLDELCQDSDQGDITLQLFAPDTEFSIEQLEKDEKEIESGEYYSNIVLLTEYEGGGIYTTIYNEKYNRAHLMWLCGITKYVFDGELPNEIYYKVVS